MAKTYKLAASRIPERHGQSLCADIIISRRTAGATRLSAPTYRGPAL
jgi:hypothetical protein